MYLPVKEPWWWHLIQYFTMFFAILLFKEKWNRWVVLGMIIAISGSLLAMTKGHPTDFLQHFGFGQMLLLGALVCWGCLYVISP